MPQSQLCLAQNEVLWLQMGAKLTLLLWHAIGHSNQPDSSSSTHSSKAPSKLLCQPAPTAVLHAYRGHSDGAVHVDDAHLVSGIPTIELDILLACAAVPAPQLSHDRPKVRVMLWIVPAPTA